MDSYVGQNVKIGFKLVSDNGGGADGFYFDDLKVEKLVPSATGVNAIHGNEIFISQSMPNPANDYAYINYNLPKGESSMVMVYNSFGQLVFSETIDPNAKSYRLNTSKLAQGVYFYNITSGKKASETLRLSIVR